MYIETHTHTLYIYIYIYIYIYFYEILNDYHNSILTFFSFTWNRSAFDYEDNNFQHWPDQVFCSVLELFSSPWLERQFIIIWSEGICDMNCVVNLIWPIKTVFITMRSRSSQYRMDILYCREISDENCYLHRRKRSSFT